MQPLENEAAAEPHESTGTEDEDGGLVRLSARPEDNHQKSEARDDSTHVLEKKRGCLGRPIIQTVRLTLFVGVAFWTAAFRLVSDIASPAPSPPMNRTCTFRTRRRKVRYICATVRTFCERHCRFQTLRLI
jgi:hypothetical protein